MRLKNCRLYLLVVIACCCLEAQAQSAPASVTYAQTFPMSDPEHYSIKVESDGHSTYQSDGKLSLQSEKGEKFNLEFVLSDANRDRIFALTKKAKYFEGKVDSGKTNLASTGEKVLSYSSAEKNTSATYNYSPNLAIQELTRLFQDLSTTLEFGRRLQFQHRYQKLALDEELKRMEQMYAAGSLQEVSALSPILQKIVDDHSAMNVVRARAQRLLLASSQPSAKSKP